MRQLQLKRFDIIFKSREVALANLKRYENTYADGEIMAAAFYDTVTGSGIPATTTTDISYIIGIYVKKGNEKKLVTIDIKDIEKQIKEVKQFIQNTLVYASGVEQVTATTYTDTTSDNYKVKMENGNDKFFRLFFTPTSSDNDKVSVTIGDIKAGTTAATLKGYTLSRLIDSMLFKTIYPTIISEPNATISRPTVGNAAEVEVGTTINESAFNLRYNKGQAQVLMESGNLPVTSTTGNETARQITYKVGNNAATPLSNSLQLNEVGTYTFSGSINYSNGDVLHDSKGNQGDSTGIEVFPSRGATSTVKRPNPQTAGSVSTTTTVSTYYKPGANLTSITNDLTDIVKLNIKAAKGMVLDFKSDEKRDTNQLVTEGGGYQVAVPHAVWNGNKGTILKFNAGSGKFEGPEETNDWTITPNALKLTDAAGNQYDCDLLEHKKGSKANNGNGSGRVAFQFN